MSGWYVYDGLFRAATLVLAAVVIPTMVRKRVGGRAASYVGLTAGLMVLAAGEAFRLVTTLDPDGWLSRLVGVHLPTYTGGYLLILVGFLSLMRDVKKAGEAMRRERDFVQGLIETNDLFIVGLSLPDGRITMFNHGAELISGYRRDEVLGREHAEVFLAPDDRPAVREAMERTQTAPSRLIGQREGAILIKSGERRLLAWTYTVSPGTDGRPNHVAAFGHDVTAERQMQASLEKAKGDLERANADLEHLATTDGLTGLLNRRHAVALLGREIARSRRNGTPVGVVLIDLDYFKAINDTHGHEAGDAALKCLADQLRRRLRATDILARYGGDEFLLVLSETGLDAAARLADVIRQRIEEAAAVFGEIRIHLSISLGVTVLEPGQEASVDDLVRRADEAMYRAKRLGGNRVVTWNPAPADPVPSDAATARGL